MEADCDGMLVRQHQGGMKVKIVKNPVTKYRIQRIKQNYPKEYAIVCTSPFVSKVHCEISRKDGAYWIHDCGSTNGTFLNGYKIETERELRFGDIIGVGISHLDTDPAVDITGPTFFIFMFTKFQIEQPQEINISDSSDDEIRVLKVVESSPSKPSDSSACEKPIPSSSGSLSNASISRAPTPLETTINVNSSTKSSGGKDVSKKVTSHKAEESNQSVPKNVSNKRTLDQNENGDTFRKRVRTDGLSNSSEISSDDSSDGLGDVHASDDSCYLPPKHPPSSYSDPHSPLGHCSSDEAPEFNFQKEEISSSASSTESERDIMEIQEDEEDKIRHLKMKALNWPCKVKLHRIMYHDLNDPTSIVFTDSAKKQIPSENRNSIRKTYYNMVLKNRNKSRRSSPLPSTSKQEQKRRLSSRSTSSDSLSDLSPSRPISKKLKRVRVVIESKSSSSEDETEELKSPSPPQTINEKMKPRPTVAYDNDDNESDEEGEVRDDYSGEIDPKAAKTSITSTTTTPSTSVSHPSNVQEVQRHAGPSPEARRTIKFIDSHECPVPRSVQIAQNRSAAFKKPLPPKPSKLSNVTSPVASSSSTFYDTAPQTPDEFKKARSEKLRELELKRQQEKGTEEAPARAKATAKIKLTTRNRNQGLMEDIVGDKFSDRDSLVGMPPYKPPSSALSAASNVTVPVVVSAAPTSTTTTPTATESFTFTKPLPPPPRPPVIGSMTSRSLPSSSSEKNNGNVVLSDPRLVRSQHYQSVAQTVTSSSKPTVIEKHLPSSVPSVPPSHPSSSNAACLLKPGAAPILSPPAKVAPISCKEKLVRDTDYLKHQKMYAYDGRSYLPEEEIYRIMVAWNATWIEEQKKLDEPPPICKEEVICTVKAYQNYDVYFKTYYPLLVHEIWATICNEAEKRQDDSSNRRTCEYKIKIDDLREEKYCPLAKKSKPKEPWLAIKYHAFVNNVNEIDTKKEFLKLTLLGKDKDKVEESMKEVFAFGIFSSEMYIPLKSGTECDQRLISGKGANGFKFCERIFCRVPHSFTIDKSKIMKLERLCYISPKIREFKSLNMLRSYRLYPNIVNPPERIRNIWKPPTSTSFKQNMLTICNRRLNNEQMSMVDHIGSRVFSRDPELMLMHGPPGTGKTTTIVCLVLQILNDSKKKLPTHTNRRILICTPSNAAIDEIMRRLVEAGKCLPSTFNGGKKLEILRMGEGFARDLEEYTITAKVKSKGKDFSVVTTLKAELDRKEEEISDMQDEIAEMKADVNKDMVTYESKLSKLREAEESKRNLEVDIDNVMKKRNTKEINDMRRAAVLQEADVICSTLSASSNSMMKNIAFKVGHSKEKPFLCCIIDEASQTTEPESLLPLALDVDKLLLVGDPYQLGATVLSSLAEDKGYNQSLFTRLFEHYNRQKDNNPVMMLTQQFRMHPEIVKWPNKFFYSDRLRTPHLSRTQCPLAPYYFMNLTSGRELSNCGQIENVQEVDLVKALMKILDDCLMPTNSKWTIGVITPYAKQKSVLKREFHNVSFKNFNSVDVDTVDGFQGQEKDIVVVSCVRTDGTGFLKSPNRLNVALTRAKHALYIVGDANCLSKDPMWRCLIQDAANRNCKVEIPPDFATNSKVFQGQLKLQLTLKGELMDLIHTFKKLTLQ